MTNIPVGWQCPACGKTWSPYVRSCSCAGATPGCPSGRWAASSGITVGTCLDMKDGMRCVLAEGHASDHIHGVLIN